MNMTAPGGLKRLAPLLAHPDYQHAAQDPWFFTRGIGGLHSPLTLPDMERAVGFLRRAVEHKGSIVVVGDRDVDGVTSTALIGSFLRRVHASAGGPLDLRVSSDGDDYGLSGRFFEDLRSSSADLFIFLDMGSSHGPEVGQLTEAGARAIVLDHHQLSGRQPEGDDCAFVNPLRDPERYVHGGKIATVGLAFKLLAGYALSFTQEWQRFEYFPGEDGGGVLLRAGTVAGTFASEVAARSFVQRQPGGVFSAEQPGKAGRYSFLEVAGPHAFRLGDPHRLAQRVFTCQVAARPRLAEFLEEAADIAAVGLLADLVPLVGENRTIVRLGMGLIRSQRRAAGRKFRPGLAALLKRSNVSAERIWSRDLAWSISPVLNAAGRMGRTDLALSLLLAEEADEARRLSAELTALNQERRDRTKRNELIAAQVVGAKQQGALVFCYHPDLEPGVSGIVAARLAESFGRPAAFLNRDGAHARGSLRCYRGENVLELLATAEDLVIQFGGHKEAAGFSVALDRIADLEERLRRKAEELWSGNASEVVPPEPHLDLAPRDLDFRLLDELALLEPFGPGNPEPIFRLRSVTIEELRPIGSQEEHALLRLRGAPAQAEAILWRRAEEIRPIADRPLDLVGGIEFSFFRATPRLRFRVESFTESRVAAGQEPLLVAPGR